MTREEKANLKVLSLVLDGTRFIDNTGRWMRACDLRAAGMLSSTMAVRRVKVLASGERREEFQPAFEITDAGRREVGRLRELEKEAANGV